MRPFACRIAGAELIAAVCVSIAAACICAGVRTISDLAGLAAAAVFSGIGAFLLPQPHSIIARHTNEIE